MKSTNVRAAPQGLVGLAGTRPTDGRQGPGRAEGLVDLIHPTRAGRTDSGTVADPLIGGGVGVIK